MQNEKGLTPAQRELENALGQLHPVTTGNRDVLLFRAGVTAARRQRRTWQGVSGILVLMLAFALLYRADTEQSPMDEYIAFDQQYQLSPIGSDNGPRDGSYLRLRDKILEVGLDALPQRGGSSGASEPPMTRREMMEVLLSS